MAERRRLPLLAALPATLALLLAHAAVYRFLCDDAFIAFRYARNLAGGHGLVFNAGFERVEGYTNFLWVILLAAFDRAGLAPERVAPALSMMLTIALWGLVAWWAARRRRGVAAAVFAPLVLACSRSVAVWSTGGLETRLFEVLVVAGTLRLLVELERGDQGEAATPWSGALLALAALTRPDGALIGACVLVAGAVLQRGRGALRSSPWAARAALFAVPLAAHEIFRVWYYGAWLPNTFGAKVGGRLWWDMGSAHLGAFLLEYGAFLWLPVLALAVGRHRRLGTTRVPWLFAAAVIPHALYVVAIGGDHFEYRPFDLVFPFAAILLADGLEELARARGARVAAAAALAVTFGLVWLPLRAHLDFPSDRYRGFFPGGWVEDAGPARFLDPGRDPLLRWPGLRLWPQAHRALVRRITAAAVGIRQEEHALFLAEVLPQGARVAAMRRTGAIPDDFRLALYCVGAVPYVSGLPTLDRLGLTDARVARMPPSSPRRTMAHERRDTSAYERAAAVDLGALRATRLVFDASDPELLPAVASALQAGLRPVAIPVAGGGWLVGTAPQGAEALASRVAPSPLVDLTGAGAREALAREMASAVSPAAEAGDLDAVMVLAQARLLLGDNLAALGLYERAAATAPDRLSVWKGLAGARAATGNLAGARAALARGVALARERGAGDVVDELTALLARLGGA